MTDGTGLSGTATRTVTVNNGGSGGLSLAVTSPKPGATVSATTWATVWITSTGSTAPYTYTLSVGGRQVWSQSSSSVGPVTMPWDTTTTPNGAATLTAAAIDAAGKSGTASVNVTVQNASASLSAAITSPASGATVSGTITVGLSASGGAPPYTYALKADASAFPAIGPAAATTASEPWDTKTVADGSHTLTLTVTDSAGATATDTKPVTVSNAASSTPLTIAMTAPKSGATVSGTTWATVWITSAGSTPPYAYTLRVGTQQVWTQSSSSTGPVTMPWDTKASATPNGPATLTAVVTDAGGRSGSASVSVVVSNP